MVDTDMQVVTGTDTVSSAKEASPDRRTQIIETAVIILNEIGYERARISDIAGALDMGKGTFYLYFKNKKEMLLAIFDYVVETLDHSVPDTRKDDFIGQATRMERVQDHEWWPGLLNLLRTCEKSHDPEIRTRARETYDAVVAGTRVHLEEAVRAGQARPVDVELAAYGIVGLADNLRFRAGLDDRYSHEQIIDFACDAIVHWLASDEFVGRVGRKSAGSESKRYLLKDNDGTEFEVEDLRFDDAEHLPATLGQARIDVDFAVVAALRTFAVEDGLYIADIATIAGDEVRVSIDSSTTVSGATPLGRLSIPLHSIDSIVR